MPPFASLAWRPSPSVIFFSLGMTAQVAQIVLLRELLTTFCGNEFAIALILGNWLLWTAAGSFIARTRNTPITPLSAAECLHLRRCYAAASSLGCVIVPLEIAGIRMLRLVTHVSPGEYLSLSLLLIISGVLLAPMGLIFGGQFALGARLFGAPARLYIAECMGGATAGLLLSLLLIPSLNSFALVFLASILHLRMTLAVLFSRQTATGQKLPYDRYESFYEFWTPCRLRNLIFGLLLLQLACLAFSGSIDAAARRAFWRAFSPELTLVGSRESPYGNIAILKSGNTPKESLTAKGTGQFNVYQSGRLVCSLPDRGEAAPLAHLCMVQRQSPPRRILLIGGGFAGMLKEILKHPVQTVDYVEIDPLLIRVAWQFSGAQDRKALEDRRVRIHHVDGRAFVRRNRERYDLILVNAPEPVTTQSNRFFTREFFQNIRQRLNEDGIFCLGAVTSEPLYQGEDILRRNGSIYATLRNVFPQVLITPGNPCYFLASAGTDAPTLESAIVLKRLTDRGIKSTDIFPLVEDFYVRKVNYELRTGRSYDALGTSTTPAPDAIRPLNTDLRPIVYYYSIQVWSRIVGDRTFVGVRRLENAGIGLLAALLLGAGWWGWRTTVKDGSGAGRLQVVAAGMLACGLTGMVMEMMTILAFQNTVGSIYQSVGVLVALFMLGLACGARWALTRAPSQRAGFSFAMVQTTLTIFALATPFLLQSLEGLELSVAEAFAYGALNLIAGALVGCAFPLGVALTGDGNDSKAALLYAADLLGGCLGALVISPWLLPRWGLATVALLCAGLNGIATIWAWKTVGVEKAAT